VLIDLAISSIKFRIAQLDWNSRCSSGTKQATLRRLSFFLPFALELA
jgi:hypothetical protein